MEKGEIAHLEQFHLFLQCFPKATCTSFSVLKQVHMEERFNIRNTLYAYFTR